MENINGTTFKQLEEKMNRKQLNISILLICSFIIAGIFAMEVDNKQTEKEEKWGQIALQEVKKQFPNIHITEYKYVKKKKINNEKVKDIFKINGALKHNHPFMAFVTVTFNPNKNDVIAIEIEQKHKAPY